MHFVELKEFVKDVKRLTKKYNSIPTDIEVVKQILEVLPDERPPFSFRISNLGIKTCVIKVKKIACKSLKGRGVHSGLRLVYALHKEPDQNLENDIKPSNQVNPSKITFVELYHKSSKENADIGRILKYFE